MIFVYKLTRSDGKEYIGKSANFKNRLSQHKKHKRFKNYDIIKYEILHYCLTHEEALLAEKNSIKQYDTFYNGLNSTIDGTGNNYSDKFTTKGFKFTEESKKKMSSSSLKRKAINSVRKWHDNLEKDRKTLFYKNHSIKTKGKPKPTKIDENVVIDILTCFKNKIPLEGVGEKRPNGRKMSYRQAFSLHFSKKYTISPRAVVNIIENRVLSWKPFYEKIIPTKF